MRTDKQSVTQLIAEHQQCIIQLSVIQIDNKLSHLMTQLTFIFEIQNACKTGREISSTSHGLKSQLHQRCAHLSPHITNLSHRDQKFLVSWNEFFLEEYKKLVSYFTFNSKNKEANEWKNKYKRA